MKFALLVCYDGTNYGGWQIQKNAVTVQEKLTLALEKVLGKKVAVNASGRTDSGVHARGQVCCFCADTDIPAEKFADAINFHLPDDISVLKSCAVEDSFDVTAGAKRKTYCYRIYLSKRRNPLKDRYSQQVKFALDTDKLKEGAKLFVGEKDFKAYCAAGSSVKTTVRKIYSLQVLKNGEDISFWVTGNGFLYNMVRTMIGTLIDYSAGRLEKQDIINSLTSGDRASVGKTMPAKGLTLESADYGTNIFI